ncbi:MAG: hypothetical protein AB7R69_01385 [Candidatus Babeliales bacterium]
MKKLMLALAIFAAAASAEAGYRNCYTRGTCKTSCVERVCEPKCSPCKVDRIVEQPCPEAPCCVRYVKVEEPAIITKHISYSWACPSGCSEENKAAGMMKAGEHGNFN